MLFRLTISQEFEPLCDRLPSRLPSHPPPSSLSLMFVVAICSVRREPDNASKEERLPHKECGRSRSRGSIFGGTDVQLGEFPWAAMIGKKINTSSITIDTVVYRCGGSLITDQYVLTAAHCILNSTTMKVPENVLMFKVSLGMIDRSPSYPDRNHRKIYDVEEYIVHYNFLPETAENDIALLKLDEKITFNDYTRPICLPSKELRTLLTGEKTVVAGWGRTHKGSISPRLLRVDVTVWESDQCKSAYHFLDFLVDERVVCAGGVENEDSCDGDSGGPLMWKPKDVWTLVGVVSWGMIPCGSEGYPGVYTRTSAFRDWILDNLDI